MAASGVTAIAGFGVLALSDIRMLRDFGLVTLIDLSVSLAGVLIALPAAIVIAERDEPLRLRGRAHAGSPRLARPLRERRAGSGAARRAPQGRGLRMSPPERAQRARPRATGATRACSCC